MDDKLKPLPFVITATARCGTQQTSLDLTRAGVTATHEKIFSFHGKPFSESLRKQHPESMCEVSWLTAPYLLSSWLLNRAAVIHQMRNPWGTLKSLVENVPMFGDKAKDAMGTKPCVAMFIEKHVPAVYQHEDKYAQAAEYILAWHELMQTTYASRCFIAYRVEDDISILLERMRNVQESKRWRGIHPVIPLTDIERPARTPVEYHPDDVRLPARLKYGLLKLADRWGYM